MEKITLDALLRLVSEQPSGGGRGKGSSDAGNNLEGNAGFGERGNLLGGAAKEQRVATLEATTVRLARACSIIRALISSCVMFLLPQRLPTLTISARGEARRESPAEQDRRAAPRRRFEAAQRLHGKQIGIARSGSDQVNLPFRSVLVPAAQSQLPRRAKSASQSLALRKLMQQSNLRASPRGCVARTSRRRLPRFQPRADVFGQLLVDLAAQPLSEGGLRPPSRLRFADRRG